VIASHAYCGFEATIRSWSKDWLAPNQDMSERNNVYPGTVVSVSSHYENPSKKSLNIPKSNQKPSIEERQTNTMAKRKKHNRPYKCPAT
jgi:hypothetical protein